MDVDKLEAGPELDRLVGKLILPEMPRDPLCYCYSTNVASAWLVVEHMYSHGWTVDVGSLALIPRGWCCHMVNNFCDDFFKHPIYVEENADTAPLAICRAALKAVNA